MRWQDISLVVRVVKALINGSNFLWLALPLVTLQVCGSTIAQTTGYQALSTGVTVPQGPATYGQDWWVLGIAVFAIVGIAAAIRGGLLGAAIGLGSSILGIVALLYSISFYSAPTSADTGWSPVAGDGGNAIGLSFFGTGVLDLGYMSVRSWHESRRQKGTERGRDWTVLAVVSSFFLGVIALGALGVVLIVLSMPHQ